ncbi:hypothetical protein [Endozoicomonas sp.]|uniref:hypothetical protein n=1 Tax=Endozoicomonas sp. TaxID=1892382 RepID=UPI003AF862DF
MSKSEVVESIKAVTVGSKDMSNNLIINVLAKHNEYAIYEIETDDINNRLKVLIDGHTDEAELKIQSRFNIVKQKYIEAKGMLSKSSNFEMMKHRIAHTLSSCLNSDDTDGKKEFSELISTITREHEELVINRTLYLSPVFISTIFLFALMYCNIDLRIENTPLWQLTTISLATTLGSGISIFITAKTLNFEDFKTKKYYFMLGVERIFLSFMAGAIAFIAIRSGILTPKFISESYWSYMFIMVIAGFSESFIPRFLSKSESTMHNK